MKRFEVDGWGNGDWGYSLDPYGHGDYVLYHEAKEMIDERDKRIAELEAALKTALEFVPKSVAKHKLVKKEAE